MKKLNRESPSHHADRLVRILNGQAAPAAVTLAVILREKFDMPEDSNPFSRLIDVIPDFSTEQARLLTAATHEPEWKPMEALGDTIINHHVLPHIDTLGLTVLEAATLCASLVESRMAAQLAIRHKRLPARQEGTQAEDIMKMASIIGEGTKRDFLASEPQSAQAVVALYTRTQTLYPELPIDDGQEISRMYRSGRRNVTENS